ncbi:hypothetical protein MEQU1_003692 [Malassezia equina]|uniref:Uncharacterized protein n=1 Tax=Malassezia equina TaxID=1381935 RepID=A0AAF0J5G7_9BASI|nr:hypothetical protein MEQU1_003692 [Malassezia equina]
MLESKPRPYNVSDIARTLARMYPAHTYYSYQFFLQQNLMERLNLLRRLEERQAQRGGSGGPTALPLQHRPAPPTRSLTSSSLESLDELFEEAHTLASTTAEEAPAEAHEMTADESEEEEMDEEAILAFEALHQSRQPETQPAEGDTDAGSGDHQALAHDAPMMEAASTDATPVRDRAAPAPAEDEPAAHAQPQDALFEEPGERAPPTAPAAQSTPLRRLPRVSVLQAHVERLIDALVETLDSSGMEASSMDLEAQLAAPIPADVLERVADACAPPRPSLMAWQQYAELHARTLWQTALDRWSLRATPSMPPSPDGSERSVSAVLAGTMHTPESQAIPPQYTPHSVRVGQRSGHHDAKASARAHLERIPPEAPSPTMERHAPPMHAPPRRAALAEERMARALYEARVWELCADYGLASPRQLVPFLLPVGGDLERCRRRLERHMRQLAQRYDMDVATLVELLEAQHGDLKQLTTVLDIQRRGRSRRWSRTPSAST